jgi:hypothetical protein
MLYFIYGLKYTVPAPTIIPFLKHILQQKVCKFAKIPRYHFNIRFLFLLFGGWGETGV